MSELVKTETMNIETVWDKDSYGKIRKMFAPELTNQEFGLFVGLGKSLGANPFLREIWAVKYGNSEAQIFLGRDFYRRKAQEQSEYKGHQVDAIYSNDKFKMIAGKPEHEYNLTDRGDIIGAYAVVHRSDNEPFFLTVKFDEYDTGKTLWKQKPETMIKKVAEAQALRGAFQGVFAGTYDQSEEWVDEEVENNPSQYAPLPEEVEPLRGRYPFDKTLKAPKNDHRPYLNDGSEELGKVEQDIIDGILDPRYIRYFYIVTNAVWEYLTDIPNQLEKMDEQTTGIDKG